MKKVKEIKEYIYLAAILIMSAMFNFINLGIEGYSNQYYAAGVKSMTMSLKNFFFVAMDSAGFVTIDKPPLGFWLQAISAKIFGFSGWSILLPQALAGVLSVLLIYIIVKKTFGCTAGLISALCLSVTPVFVAVSRNNTVDNILVLVLLLACWTLSAAAREGKFKYLALSMVFIGIGFNVKMLQAYMILPAIYITYLLANKISVRRRIAYLLAGTVIMLAVSFTWALVVDSIPADSRPYVGSSSDNMVTSLIIGHNGAERLSFGSILGIFNKNQAGYSQGGQVPGNPGMDGAANRSDKRMDGGPGENLAPGQPGNARGGPDGNFGGKQGNNAGNIPNGSFEGDSGINPGAPPDRNVKGRTDLNFGGGPGGNSGSGLSGTFGNQTPAGITRLFLKNVLSDQIVWFILIAFIGFIAASIKEKLRIKLDTGKKQALVLWFMWLLPEFIYFSFNTGLFHSYYLTMMAPPIAALTGIGLVSMWKMYKEGGWKSWFLPFALLANGLVQVLMLSYFYNTSGIVKILMGLLIGLCFTSVLALSVINIFKNSWPNKLPKKMIKIIICLAIAGNLVSPATGSAAAMFYPVNSSFPGAGLELLPSQSTSSQNKAAVKIRDNYNIPGIDSQNDSIADLVKFLNNHKVNGKSQIVVASSNTAERLILNTDLYVGSLSGFMGNEKVMSLERFKERVKKGEIRYVLADTNNGRGGSSSEIIDWVKENGKLVSYSSTDTSANSNKNSSEQIYDLAGSFEN